MQEEQESRRETVFLSAIYLVAALLHLTNFAAADKHSFLETVALDDSQCLTAKQFTQTPKSPDHTESEDQMRSQFFLSQTELSSP